VSSLSLRRKLKIEPAFLLLLALASLLFLSHLGAFRDFVRAESYFALGARLMVEEGDWLSMHAPDEPVLNKPPLQYWLTGLTYKIFGASYTTARLPSALAALCVLVVLYLLGARLYEAHAGLLATGILATSFLFYTFSRIAMSDMLLTMCVTGALACFILALAGKATDREAILVMCGYLFVALGVLAKGPIAILLVAGPLALELLFSRDLSMLKRLRIFSGLLIILCMAGPYFLLLYLKLGSEPLRAFFIGENLQRFTGDIYAYASRPIWYLPLAFLGDFAPWSLLLFPALYFDWRTRPTEPDARRARRLIYLWLFFPLVFFSFSHFKLDYYLLPAMPAAALLTGAMGARAATLPLWARVYIYGFTLLFALVLIGASFASMRIAAVLLPDTGFGWLMLAGSAGASLFMLYALYKGWPRRALWALIFSIWFLLLVYEWMFVPALSRFQAFERFAASITSTNARAFTSRAGSDWANTLAFHLPPDRKVTRLAADRDDAQLKEVLEQEPQAVVLLEEKEYERLLQSGFRLRTLAEAETLGHGGISLSLLRNPKMPRLRIVRRETIADGR
jgi:4-amino-4-deoxy-L-arabinose transferase-like glycosyltransferase